MWIVNVNMKDKTQAGYLSKLCQVYSTLSHQKYLSLQLGAHYLDFFTEEFLLKCLVLAINGYVKSDKM